MHTDRSDSKRCEILTGRLAAGLLAAAAGLACIAHAEPGSDPSARPPSDLARLERAFWICDHAATTHGVDGDTAMLCVVLTDELKQSKFGGDFEQMLAWWRRHKLVEHAKLDGDPGSLASR